MNRQSTLMLIQTYTMAIRCIQEIYDTSAKAEGFINSKLEDEGRIFIVYTILAMHGSYDIYHEEVILGYQNTTKSSVGISSSSKVFTGLYNFLITHATHHFLTSITENIPMT